MTYRRYAPFAVLVSLVVACGGGGGGESPGSPGGACEPCTDSAGCATELHCAPIGGGFRACQPACDLLAQDCPVGFSCIDEPSVGRAVCLPAGSCCIDADVDGYGQGADCAGPDCDPVSAQHWADCGACVDGDGDGFGAGCDLGDDCDDSDPDEFPGRSWYADCDGDGVAAANEIVSCAQPASPCAGGAPPAGGWLHTAPAVPDCADDDRDRFPGSSEICDGKDNDCDPATEDGSGDPQVGASCDGPDADLCSEGTLSCSAGALACSDDTGSTPEVCNGLDDDCDPTTEDGSEDPEVGTPCDGPDSDLCNEGTISCAGGALACSDTSSSTLDLCNGVDDDCDPASADGSEDPQNGAACDGPDADLCMEGTLACAGGALACSDATSSTPDVCNGLDDDCDPSTEDGSGDPQLGTPCDGPDSDLCKEGTISCTGGALACSDATGSTLDLCNGVDDDCDPASADGSEDPQNGVACDGSDGDLCLEGTFSCTAGALVCSDNTSSTVELCNGVDDDCNGAIDQADVPVSVMCAAVPNATRDCAGAAGCVITGCSTNYVDTNGIYGDGCECLAQPPLAQGTSCASAITLGSLTDSLAQSVTVTGNTPTAGRSVWYVFTGVDDLDTNGDEYHVDGRFLVNPGAGYRMDVYRGSCAGTQLAANEGAQFDWFTDQNYTTVGCTVSAPCGEGNCTSINQPGRNLCTSDTANYYVRVYRVGGAATCGSYTIQFSNGIY